MRRTRAILALLLACTMIPFCLSCGKEQEEGESGSRTGGDPAESKAADDTAETRAQAVTGLPEDLQFDGDSYRIHNLTSGSYYDTFVAFEQTGDSLNDAIYSRDQQLMQKLNFVFEETKDTGDSNTALTAVTRKLIQSGEDIYEQYMLVDWAGYTLAQEGYALPVSAIPYIDVSREYWSQSIHRDISIGGKLYFAFGAHNLSTYDSVNVLLFNKQLSEDIGLDNHYETVLDGGWTLDKMEANMQRALSDLDGDGNWTEKDRYGITGHAKQVLPVFWVGAGIRVVEKDENDLPVFRLGENEKFDTLYTRILSMMHDENLMFVADVLPNYPDNSLFREGGALYNIVRVAFLHYYREMETPYGILPYPKFDSAQDTYYSRTEGAFLYVYPTTLSKFELTGAVTEAMACASLNEVVPVYYDVLLKNRYARDEHSIAMLDLIYDNRVYDLADTLFCATIRDGVFAGKFAANNKDLQSTIKSLQKRADNAIAKYVKAFEENA